MIEHALAYAKQGIPVFPLKGKIPFQGSNGFYDATVDIQSIQQWWALYLDANIGTPTGVHVDAVTGKPNATPFDVLDIDPRHGGPKTLARLIAELGELPQTPTQTTGSGGTHYCFWSTGTLKNTDGELGSGVDTKGTGGYIVLAPSIHPVTGQPYRWNDGGRFDDLTLAVMPPWIPALLRTKASAPVEPGQRIPLGQQHNYLLRALGAIRRWGCTESEMLALARAIGRERCDPPADDKSLQHLAASVAKYAPESPETRLLIRGIDPKNVPSRPDSLSPREAWESKKRRIPRLEFVGGKVVQR
jgi:hypothetical protein